MTAASASDAIDGLRRTVQDALPERIRAALAGYQRFTAEEPPADAKGFAAWHAAAKAALAHVEVLVKLVRWAETEPGAAGSDSGDSGLDTLLRQARQALDQFEDGDDL